MAYRKDGKERRKFFQVKADAEDFARELADGADRLGASLLACNPYQRASMLEALRRAEAGGYTLSDACAAIEATRATAGPSLPLGELRELFLAAKRAQRIRPKSLKALESSTRIFTRGYEGKPANEIQPADVSRAIADPKLSAWRHRSMLINLSTWFGWAVSLGHLRANPCDGVPRPVLDGKTPVVHRAADVERILRAAERTDPEMVAYGAIGYLAGLRPESEMARLPADGIRDGVIRIGNWNKTRRRRDVTICPALAAWLEAWGKLKVPLCPPDAPRRWLKVRRAAGYTSREHDVMRHTFVSAHYVLHGEALTVAQAGHSAQELHASYRDLMTKAEAEAIFAILPDPSADYVSTAKARLAHWRRSDPEHMRAMNRKRWGNRFGGVHENGHFSR